MRSGDERDGVVRLAFDLRARIERSGRTRVGLARLMGSAGAVLVLTGLAFWVLFVLLLFPSGERFGGSDLLDEAATAHAVCALFVLLSVLFLSERPLLSAVVLMVAFLGSFVAGFGWYFVLLPPPLALAGGDDLLYLVSAGLLVAATFEERSRH
ncbi:MAG: hypothetical protein AVDCRST_MAG37-92 [uncultured Rubrobacteraceae bacterium]|uniref:Uncharacterized protein n=1 Tax=uncultured Rubrobacteraceae bacterium TaxID=349277 RepID=A0A6J4PRH4_9ACTN|nr:MAG: hypothetical protein AVDCRST_MAG37-92 [uncultured Rubrobacteraceae bacterium]